MLLSLHLKVALSNIKMNGKVYASNLHLLISWLQSPSAVIMEPKKIKSVAVSTLSSSICHEVVGPDAMIFAHLRLKEIN